MGKQKTKITEQDYIKINKSIARKEEMELLGPGFHSKTKIHSSKKSYTRKEKHKGANKDFPCFFCFFYYLLIFL